MKKAILLLILTSCTTVGEENPQPSQVSRSVSSLTIINSAPNTTLLINECNVADISQELPYSDTLTCRVNQSADTIVIDGEINSSYPIYKGKIFIPFSNVVELESGCNWYNEDGGKVLRSIGFDVNVKDWQ